MKLSDVILQIELDQSIMPALKNDIKDLHSELSAHLENEKLTIDEVKRIAKIAGRMSATAIANTISVKKFG